MNELKRIGKSLDTFLKILVGIATAGVIVCLIAAVIVMFIDSAAVYDAKETIDLGGLSLELANITDADITGIKYNIAVLLCVAAVECVFIAVMAKTSRAVVEPIKSGEPFRSGVSSTIKRLALICLVGGAVVGIAKVIGEWMMYRIIDAQSLFDPAVVVNVTPDYDIDLGFIGVAALLYMLSLVFRCGEELQQQSDETL